MNRAPNDSHMDPHDRLYIACELGDVNEVRSWVETESIQVDFVPIKCLERACIQNHLPVVKILVERFDRDLCQEDFEGLLAQSVLNGNEDVLRYLLSNCNVDMTPILASMIGEKCIHYVQPKALLVFLKLHLEFGWPICGIRDYQLVLHKLEELQSWTEEDTGVIDAVLAAMPDIEIEALVQHGKRLRLWNRWCAIHGVNHKHVAQFLETIICIKPETQLFLCHLWSVRGIRVMDLSFYSSERLSTWCSNWLHHITQLQQYTSTTAPMYIIEFMQYVHVFLKMEQLDESVARQLWNEELNMAQQSYDATAVLILHCLHQYYHLSLPLPRPSWLPKQLLWVLSGHSRFYAACLVQDWTEIASSSDLSVEGRDLGLKFVLAGVLTDSSTTKPLQQSLKEGLLGYCYLLGYTCKDFLRPQFVSALQRLTLDTAVLDAVLEVAISDPVKEDTVSLCIHLMFLARLDGNWAEYTVTWLLDHGIDIMPKSMTVDTFARHIPDMIRKADRLRANPRTENRPWQRYLHAVLTAGEVWYGQVFIDTMRSLFVTPIVILKTILCHSEDLTILREQYRKGYFAPTIFQGSPMEQSLWKQLLVCNRVDTVRWLMEEVGITPHPIWFFGEDGMQLSYSGQVLQFVREKWAIDDFVQSTVLEIDV